MTKRRPPKPPGRKVAALHKVAAALEELTRARRQHAAEVNHLARVLTVLANEIPAAAALLATEFTAWRVAHYGAADAPGPRPVRRLGRRA